MLNQILEALSGALVGVLLVIIPIIGTKVAYLIGEKIKGIQVKNGAEKYNNEISIAFKIWGLVDEFFRITPNVTATVDAKVNMFESELLKKIPYLAKEDIDHLRQVVAGVMNQTKIAILAPAVVEIPTSSVVVADTIDGGVLNINGIVGIPGVLTIPTLVEAIAKPSQQ